MVASSKPLYVPALRMKTGELTGVRDLAPDVANCIFPRIIVPPREERDEELQQELFAKDCVPGIGRLLSNYWRDRGVFIEATYLIDDFGRDKMGIWFPKMFEMARAASVRAIPLVGLSDLIDGAGGAYKAALSQGDSICLGIVISSADLVDREAAETILRCLESLGLTPNQCSVIADFHDADFTQADLVAPIIGGVLELLQEAGRWKQIIFQGTNYPEKNPADPGSSYMVPRNEWKAWRQATKFDPATAEHLIFGDYAADCAKLVFGGNGGAAIRHYRYATGENWLIERGAKGGSDQEVMRAVCEKIVASRHFAGRSFSTADDYIFRTAKGASGPGNATTWRAINTTHHITRVVADIGGVRGVRIAKRVVAAIDEQPSFFAPN